MRTFWTDKQLALLHELYPDNYTNNLVSIIGRNKQSIENKAFNLGLKKSPAFKEVIKQKTSINLIVSGEKTRFKKGIVPYNKGQKMPIEQYEKCKKTFFKLGNIPTNSKQEGNRVLVLRKDKNGRRYYYIRVNLGKWIEFHRYVWEMFFGPIPANMIVIFKDGDTFNCHPDNLQLISKQQNARRNHNPEKTKQAFRTGKVKPTYYASRLFLKDKVARAFALQHLPELIEAKRLQIVLKNQLHEIVK